MFIVIHCGGLPFNGETIEKESLGGSETAAYYMAKELAAKGNKVTMFTNGSEGEWDGVKYVNVGNVTEQNPLGERFHFYATNTPHDVLIIQRYPAAFQYQWAAKIKLWWVHDLALVRTADTVKSNLWNMDGIITVSEFHKKQYIEVYGLNKENVFVVNNGVDLSLFEGTFKALPLWSEEIVRKHQEGQVKLLYSSRPERGLEHLVAHNGIMERLAKIDSKYHLYVCAYENTTAETEQYYKYLKSRCEELDNVTILGSLTKQELADVMRQCDAMVYPTPSPQQKNFEEVSCITAMECMAAGLPFISSYKGALSETCKGSGSLLLDLGKDGYPVIQNFVNEIEFFEDYKSADLIGSQLDAAKNFTWSNSADSLLNHIKVLFKRNISTNAIARDMLRNSDIYALNDMLDNDERNDDIIKGVCHELSECYDFAFSNTWSEHYAKYYQYEEDRGVNYGEESLEGNGRFEHVSSIISGLRDSSTVLDYGCAHGHYTINLAKRFPNIEFIGIDITHSNIEKARKWAKDKDIKNVKFICGEIPQGTETGIIKINAKSGGDITQIPLADCIIAAEVIEHIGNPSYYVDTLAQYLKLEDSIIIITTPFGAWEAMGYEEHYPFRAHVHHFERSDLYDIWGHFPDFKVTLAPSGNDKWGEPLGSYITTFKNPNGLISRSVNYQRKIETYVPRQTLTTCMIVKDAEDSLKKCLDSVKDISDEIILAIDDTTTDNTMSIISNFKKGIKGNWPIVKTISIESPLKIGFDEARNISIHGAIGDWILWIDTDEVLMNSKNIFKYLQNNSYDGYAIKQHHFAIEPLGVLKTDLPCRLFRNHKGVKFFGVVHEHPEKELNEGVGFVQLIPDLEIVHNGYATEEIRRGRFHRNIDLLVRDREKYPERILGKFLWLRDLSQMCKYELEMNGGSITEEMKERAKQGIEIWEDLLENNHLRMIIDGMEFYSLLSKITGEAFEMGFSVDTSKMNGGIHMEQALPVVANFAKREHADNLIKAIINEKVKNYESKYF